MHPVFLTPGSAGFLLRGGHRLPILHEGAPIDKGAAAGGAFKALFVVPEGHLRDFANEAFSHFEGRAWTMLLPARHGDDSVFQHVQGWAHRTLGIQSDAALALRCEIRTNCCVDGRNSATEADFCQAHVLLIVRRRQRDQGSLDLAQGVGRAMKASTVRWLRDRRLLNTGATGFEFGNPVEVKLSDHIFAAPDALNLALHVWGWRGMARRCWSPPGSACSGHPPDWLRINRRGAAPSPLTGRGDRFGCDAAPDDGRAASAADVALSPTEMAELVGVTELHETDPDGVWRQRACELPCLFGQASRHAA